MKIPSRITVASLIALTLVGSMTACIGVFGSSSASVAPSCSQLLAAAVQYQKSGTGDVDSTLQVLTDNCSDEYEIAVYRENLKAQNEARWPAAMPAAPGFPQ